jgi:putative toxin-antitoxin system antitoxin component (TIGR02293 family)
MSAAYESVAELLGIAAGPDRRTAAASPFDVIARIERGLPVAALDRVARLVAPDDANLKYRIVSRATFARRKKRQGQRLTADESDRLARLAKVWAFAREVWGGDAEARAFLLRPHMMLEGRRPIDVALGTELGARLVEDILGRLKYGSAA